MRPLLVILALCLALLDLTRGTPTTSHTTLKTSSSSKATNYDINVSHRSQPSFSPHGFPSKSSIQFDERNPNPVLGALNPVGIEDTIFFNSWVVCIQPAAQGVPAHSQPNAIVTANEQQLVNGTPSLTILYPGSPLESFDLHSFFFGCVANTAASAVDVAVQCTVFVAGFRNGQEVTVASYTFTPPTAAVNVPMIQAVLPGSFVDLQNVTVIQDDPTIEVLVADDFNATTHT